jgi:lactoylglutathione lyase
VTEGIQLSHVGICVSDMERSLRFYTEGLGFTPTVDYTVGPEFGRLMEVEGSRVASQFLTSGTMTVELLRFVEPGHTGDDVDEAASSLVAAGGHVVEGTRTTIDVGPGATADFLYCTDPDGTRIELMHLPG